MKQKLNVSLKEPKKKLKIDLLGSAEHPVSNISGIVFCLNFNPELVDYEKENEPYKPKKVKFKGLSLFFWPCQMRLIPSL